MALHIPSMGECLEVGRSRGASSRAPGIWRGMRLCLPMQEGGGAKAYDVSGYGNHGTLTGMDPATDWVTTAKGRALDFDGSNDYVNVPHDVWLNPVVPFTLSGWFRTTNIANRVLWEKNGNTGFSIQILGTSPYIVLCNLGDYGPAKRIATSTGYSDGAAHHFAFVVERLSNSGNAGRVYIDGKDDTGDSSSGPANGSTASVYFGSRAGTVAYPGLLWNCAKHSRALAPSEIAQLYTRPWDHLTYQPRLFPAATAAAPLTLADDSFSNTEPFDNDEEIGTVAATGGTAPYSYEIISQTLV